MFKTVEIGQRMLKAYRQQELEASWKNTPPVQPSDLDYDSWQGAASQRTRPRTREQIITALRHKNPVRVRRLHKDFKWMQREMKKMGLNPEDARELL